MGHGRLALFGRTADAAGGAGARRLLLMLLHLWHLEAYQGRSGGRWGAHQGGLCKQACWHKPIGMRCRRCGCDGWGNLAGRLQFGAAGHRGVLALLLVALALLLLLLRRMLMLVLLALILLLLLLAQMLLLLLLLRVGVLLLGAVVGVLPQVVAVRATLRLRPPLLVLLIGTILMVRLLLEEQPSLPSLLLL